MSTCVYVGRRTLGLRPKSMMGYGKSRCCVEKQRDKDTTTATAAKTLLKLSETSVRLSQLAHFVQCKQTFLQFDS